MWILPSGVLSLARSWTRVSCALGAAPPYSPECRSPLSTRTVISAAQSPRRPTSRAGHPGAKYPVSDTSTASASTRSGSRSSRSNSTLLPDSSCPSMRNRRLTGGGAPPPPPPPALRAPHAPAGRRGGRGGVVGGRGGGAGGGGARARGGGGAPPPPPPPFGDGNLY